MKKKRGRDERHKLEGKRARLAKRARAGVNAAAHIPSASAVKRQKRRIKAA